MNDEGCRDHTMGTRGGWGVGGVGWGANDVGLDVLRR